VLPHSARDREESGYQISSTPQSMPPAYLLQAGLHPSRRHSPAPSAVVGTSKVLPAHFPGKMQPCTASLPAQAPVAAAWSLPVPRRPDSLAVFLFEVTSQLIHGLGFLSASQPASVPGAGGTQLRFPRQDWESC